MDDDQKQRAVCTCQKPGEEESSRRKVSRSEDEGWMKGRRKRERRLKREEATHCAIQHSLLHAQLVHSHGQVFCVEATPASLPAFGGDRECGRHSLISMSQWLDSVSLAFLPACSPAHRTDACSFSRKAQQPLSTSHEELSLGFCDGHLAHQSFDCGKTAAERVRALITSPFLMFFLHRLSYSKRAEKVIDFNFRNAHSSRNCNDGRQANTNIELFSTSILL